MMNDLKIWMLCDRDCPLRQFLNLDLETGLERMGPEPPGVSVCGAEEETWDAGQVPEECPYLHDVSKPWERQEEEEG